MNAPKPKNDDELFLCCLSILLSLGVDRCDNIDVEETEDEIAS